MDKTKIMKLSILIASVEERKNLLQKLLLNFTKQISKNDFQEKVEIVTLIDNKEISIGQKRQNLLNMAKGEYIVFFDDDDTPYTHYVSSILKALKTNPDCIGCLIDMTTNGENPQTCCHSLRYKDWAENTDGYDYVRNVTHFNPVKLDIAKQIGFKDLRYGEDKEYSDAVTKLCKNEVFIDKPIFHYNYSNQLKHNMKYGIK